MLQTATGARLRRAAIALALAACIGACDRGRDPIVIRDGMLVLENQTTREWRNVRVTVNDHFSGGARSLPAGGLMNAPLKDFQSGFGHRFEPGRMPVQKVRVSATDAAGQPVSIAWGK
jgi:hypothetical protein